jgi:uncharacterized protein (TIGR02145 family)
MSYYWLSFSLLLSPDPVLSIRNSIKKIIAPVTIAICFSCSDNDSPPASEITSIDYVTQSTAIIHSAVTEEHPFYVTKGVVYNLSPEPTIENQILELYEAEDVFRVPLTGLEPNTIYYVRPYTKNIEGITYGEQQSFKTDAVDIFTDVRDGNTYTEIDIVDHVWMGENMRFEIEGMSLPVKNLHELLDDDRLGLLYPIEVCEEVCPSGWHLPSDEEWKTLESILRMPSDLLDSIGLREAEANMIREPGTEYWRYDNDSITNSLGFTALPAGQSDANGYNDSYGNYTTYWTAPNNSEIYYNRRIGDQGPDNTGISRIPYTASVQDINYYISVRCVQDN